VVEGGGDRTKAFDGPMLLEAALERSEEDDFWLYTSEAEIREVLQALGLSMPGSFPPPFASPLSGDRAKLTTLRRSLAVDRMVFGQPRQEELMEYLRTVVPEEDLARMAAQLRIVLAPRGACLHGGCFWRRIGVSH